MGTRSISKAFRADSKCCHVPRLLRDPVSFANRSELGIGAQDSSATRHVFVHISGAVIENLMSIVVQLAVFAETLPKGDATIITWLWVSK